MRKTATQKFLEGMTIEKVEHPPRELALHIGDGRVLRVRAYASGFSVEEYGLDFIFEKDGQQVDGKLRPLNEYDDGREVPREKRCQASVGGIPCHLMAVSRVWTDLGAFRACGPCGRVWAEDPDRITWMIDADVEE